MFGVQKRLSEGVQELVTELREIRLTATTVLNELAGQEPGTDPELYDRVAALERTLEQRMAEADATHLRATSERRAARAAEERARGMESRARALAEPDEELDPFEEAALRHSQERDARGSEEEGVPAMRPVLDDDAIARALGLS